MSTYYRRDEWVTDALGNAQSGASVYVCSQPANTTSIPPSPLQQVYADSAGVTPLTQPILTDGYGHAFYYVLPGTYTVVYSGPQIQQVNLLDQTIAAGSSVSIPVSVAQGGTNATTAAQALTNLGAAASGANVDITSLGNVPNTVLSTVGYKYGPGTFSDTINSQATIANMTWTGTGVTGYGFGVSNTTSYSLVSANSLSTSGTVIGNVFTCLGNSAVSGQFSVGSAAANAAGLIVARGSSNNYLQLEGASVTGLLSVLIDSGSGPTPTAGVGLLGFNTNYPTQTTIGANGAASALTANPVGYLQVAIHGSEFVIPYYNH